MALLLSVVFAVNVAAEEAEGGSRAARSWASAVDSARESGRPLFVHFTAPWCKPCRALKDTVYPHPAVAAELASFVRVEVDVETPAGAALEEQLDVRGVPSLAFFGPDGVEFREYRTVGFVTPEVLAKRLAKIRAKTAGPTQKKEPPAMPPAVP